MNAQAKRQQPLTAEPVTISAADGRKLAESLMDAMNALLSVIEQEAELVRAGKLREAMQLEPQKTESTRRYIAAIGQLKVNQKALALTAPELLTALHRHHGTFRAMLQVNLTVLATAHAVSESIVRGVNAEMQRRSMPNTYTAAGRRAVPGPRHVAPLSMSRSL